METFNKITDTLGHFFIWGLHTFFISMLRIYKFVRRSLTSSLHIYPAGGMEKAINAGKGWRTYFRNKLLEIFEPICFRIVYANPCEFEWNNENFNVNGYDRDDVERFKKNNEYVAVQRERNRRILVFDCLKVIMSDFVIAKYDAAAHAAAGTKGEMTVAQFFKVPVYTWTTWSTRDLPNWIIGASTLIFKRPKDLFKFLKDYYTSPFRKALQNIVKVFKTQENAQKPLV